MKIGLKIVGLFVLMLFVVEISSAQQTGNWYFGSAGGNVNTGIRINWTSGTPVVSTCIPLRTEEGSSSISDASGNPLFYTDGVTVWDGATNAVLAGGTGLGGASSSTQSAIIMPRPSIANQWIIITSSTSGAKNYYIVTGTSATAGPFTVSAGTPLTGGSYGEGVFVIGNSVTGGFWIIGRHQGSTGQVSAWEVGATGLIATPNAPVISVMSGPSGFTNINNDQILGTIKSNTCQNMLAFTYFKDRVDVVGFNAATGQVLADARAFSVVSQSYGIEFSSNDEYLYATSLNSGNIYQYTLSTSTLSNIGSSSPQEAGQLQTAPNGLIYCAESDAVITATPVASFLGVINAPNTAGASYVTNSLSVALPNTCGIGNSFSYRGLPTFPKSLVVSNPVINPGDGTYCTNTSIPLSFIFGGSIDASGVTWTHTGTGGSFTPGGATSTSLSPSITFTTTGAKTVTLSFNDACGRPYTTTRNFTIISPKVPAGTKTCSGANDVRLDATGAIPGDYSNYVWYDAPTGGNIVGVGNPVNLLYPNTAAVPANFYVEVGGTVTVTSSGTNQSIASPASLTWAANAANYTVTGINVLANTLSLKSITVRPYNGTANGIFSVTIRQGATLISTFNYNVGPSYVNGDIIVLPVNLTLLQGSGYSIQLQNVSGMAGGWWGGAWAGATNANQITYPAQGAGTNGVFALVYDYQNYTTMPTCSNRVLVSGTCTLPVEWLSTTAKRENDYVVVNWSLASQTNNQRFEVQRSSDGVNFETVGVLPGKGTNNSYAEYEFLDFTSEQGKLYYRIVQFDFDGKSSNSNIVSVNPVKNKTEFSLFPNPTSGNITLTLLSTDEVSGKMAVKVYNSLGQEVYASSILATELSAGVEVDLSTVAQGVYLVKVTTNAGEWIESLIKR